MVANGTADVIMYCDARHTEDNWRLIAFIHIFDCKPLRRTYHFTLSIIKIYGYAFCCKYKCRHLLFCFLYSFITMSAQFMAVDCHVLTLRSNSLELLLFKNLIWRMKNSCASKKIHLYYPWHVVDKQTQAAHWLYSKWRCHSHCMWIGCYS